jgi:methionyl-tRNA formyltransferase
VPQKVLDIPRLKCINVHGSLLPELRGAAPIQYAILKDLKVTGITIMEMVKKMDAGDVLNTVRVKIEDEDNCGTMFEKLSYLGRDLLLETIEK